MIVYVVFCKDYDHSVQKGTYLSYLSNLNETPHNVWGSIQGGVDKNIRFYPFLNKSSEVEFLFLTLPVFRKSFLLAHFIDD
jgi:hypothetical protein